MSKSGERQEGRHLLPCVGSELEESEGRTERDVHFSYLMMKVINVFKVFDWTQMLLFAKRFVRFLSLVEMS